MKELVLDSHKLNWHKERIEAWLRGERIAPITIDCALTRRCTYRCVYCYGQLQVNDKKVFLVNPPGTIYIQPDGTFKPTPIEDMYPYLNKKEFKIIYDFKRQNEE